MVVGMKRICGEIYSVFDVIILHLTFVEKISEAWSFWKVFCSDFMNLVQIYFLEKSENVNSFMFEE